MATSQSIAVFPCFLNFGERIVTWFAEKFVVINTRQFGCQGLLNATDASQLFAGIFLDNTKAYDKVNTKKLSRNSKAFPSPQSFIDGSNRGSQQGSQQ
jgi:hypothetical protein